MCCTLISMTQSAAYISKLFIDEAGWQRVCQILCKQSCIQAVHVDVLLARLGRMSVE